MNSSRFIKALAAGVLGACAMTLAHRLVSRFLPRARRLDLPRMHSIARTPNRPGWGVFENVREPAWMNDLVSNAGYYSLVGVAGSERAVYVGAGLGLAAGLGAMTLPSPDALGEAPTGRTPATQAMIVALYTTGGLVAGSLYRALD